MRVGPPAHNNRKKSPRHAIFSNHLLFYLDVEISAVYDVPGLGEGDIDGRPGTIPAQDRERDGIQEQGCVSRAPEEMRASPSAHVRARRCEAPGIGGAAARRRYVRVTSHERRRPSLSRAVCRAGAAGRLDAALRPCGKGRPLPPAMLRILTAGTGEPVAVELVPSGGGLRGATKRGCAWAANRQPYE